MCLGDVGGKEWIYFSIFFLLLFLLKEKVTKSSRPFDAQHFLQCIFSADEWPGGNNHSSVSIHRFITPLPAYARFLGALLF